LAAFWDTVRPAEARDWCDRAVQTGAVVAAEIACTDGRWRKVFARPDALDQAASLPPPPGRMRVLSPFDPALRDRKRAQRLFGFHYRIEVFTPAARRIYGYYVFPLLEGDRLVGRVDMKAQRDAGVLEVRALWPEPAVNWAKSRATRFEAELDRVARFAGLDQVRFADGWLRDPIP
jgi:uncharacterized protein YcaQ